MIKYVPISCGNQTCPCGQMADWKVDEVIPEDDLIGSRHPLTDYICKSCFRQLGYVRYFPLLFRIANRRRIYRER